MKKRIIVIVGFFVAVILIFLAVKSIRYEHYPVHVDPSPEWEPRVSALDVQRESFFVESDGVQLEAELFIPNGGSRHKGRSGVLARFRRLIISELRLWPHRNLYPGRLPATRYGRVAGEQARHGPI